MQLAEHHATVVEEVSGADAAVQVTDVGLQPSVQLSVDVKLPGIGRFLNLRLMSKMAKFRYLLNMSSPFPASVKECRTITVLTIIFYALVNCICCMYFFTLFMLYV